MRILMLMQWFDPEPQIKGIAFAKLLRDRGIEVEVLTGVPNYPGGKVYPGYAIRMYQVETMDGIRIRRVPLYPSHDGSALRRMMNYVSFGVSAFIGGLFATRGKDLIYACGPPVTVGVAAVLVGRLMRVPVVYDIQDLWPDSLRATGMFHSSVGERIVGAICSWLYRAASRITVQSPGVKRRLVDRGVESEKISVIFNWCDESSIKPVSQIESARPEWVNECFTTDTFNVLFAGNIGKAQDLDSVIDAARLLARQNPRVRILLMGGGVELARLKKRIETEQLSNVRILPRVPMAEVGGILARADVLLVHLRDDPLFSITVPAKTQAYLAAGKPVLMGVAGDASDLIRESGAGFCATPSDPQSLADTVLTLAAMVPAELTEMGAHGARYYRERMSLEVGAGQFIATFRAAIESRAID